MKFESKFGVGEIVIRESHKNGGMIQERMMEVIAIVFGNVSDGVREISYICEDTLNGHRQQYCESMLVGDPDFNQEHGKYPIEPITTNRECAE